MLSASTGRRRTDNTPLLSPYRGLRSPALFQRPCTTSSQGHSPPTISDAERHSELSRERSLLSICAVVSRYVPQNAAEGGVASPAMLLVNRMGS